MTTAASHAEHDDHGQRQVRHRQHHQRGERRVREAVPGVRLEIVVDLAAVVHPVVHGAVVDAQVEEAVAGRGEPDEPARHPGEQGQQADLAGGAGTLPSPAGCGIGPPRLSSHTRAPGRARRHLARHVGCRSMALGSSARRVPRTPARSHASSSRPGGSRTAGCCPGRCSTTSTRRGSRGGGAQAVGRRRRRGTACSSPSSRPNNRIWWASPPPGRRTRRRSPRARSGGAARRDVAAVTDLLVEPRWGRRGHGSRLLAASVDLWRTDGFERRWPGLTSGTRRVRGSSPRPAGSPTGRPCAGRRRLVGPAAPLARLARRPHPRGLWRSENGAGASPAGAN